MELKWPKRCGRWLGLVSAETVEATRTSPALEAPQAMEALTAILDQLQSRWDLLCRTSETGYFELEADPSGLVDKNCLICAPEQSVQLLGFSNGKEFPVALGGWWGLVHPEDRGATIAAMEAYFNDRGGRLCLDWRARLSDTGGNWRWFRLRATNSRSTAGAVQRLGWTCQLIQAEVDREKELERQLNRFELASKVIHDGTWEAEIIGGDPANPKNPYWWSQQFRNLLGFETVEEFPNEVASWASRLHPDDRDKVFEDFFSYLLDRTSTQPVDLQYRLQCKDGRYRWFRGRGWAVRAVDGTPLRAAGALIDIDHLKAAEASLVERNADQSRLEASLKDIGDIVETIQQIARQTNLIALNAAVEAARAGSAGRGFAVIANEIRALSSSTTAATEEVARIRRNLAASRF